MDFDYNTVKYLVIILSLLILGYVIFLLYNDLTTVRSEFNKMKSKIFETSDSLTELQKQIEYVDAETAETDLDPEEHTLHEILNNKFFTSPNDNGGYSDTEPEEIDPEASTEPAKVPSFSFNIPFFSKNTEDEETQNKITEIPQESLLENSTSDAIEPYQEPEEIQFVSSSNKCEGIVASGKNKGKQCSKDAISENKFCSKHSKL